MKRAEGVDFLYCNWPYLFYYISFVGFYFMSVTFPVIASFFPLVYKWSVCTLMFICCFYSLLIFCLSTFLPWSFCSFDNAFTCKLHNPTPVFTVLFKSFLLVLYYLYSDICLYLCPIVISMFAHSCGKQEQSYTGIGFDISVQMWKASSFEKLIFSCY